MPTSDLANPTADSTLGTFIRSFPQFTRHVFLLDSTVMSELAYSRGSHELLVVFRKSGSLWLYSKVYPSEFAHLTTDYSPGIYFNSQIRNKKRALRLYPLPHKVVNQT